MKKLLAILLVIMMLFSVATVFAGCDEGKSKSNKTQKDDDDDDDDDEDDEDDGDDGDKGTEDPDGGETTNPDGEPTQPDATNPNATQPAVTEPAPTEPAPTEPEPTEPAPTEPIVPPALENGFALGQVTGNSYANDYAGIYIEIPSGWTFKTDSEINPGLNRNDLVSISQVSQFYDMQAVLGTSENVSVVYMNPADNEFETIKKDLVGFCGSTAQGLAAAYEAMGFSNIETESGEMNIGGVEVPGCAVFAQYNGVSIYQVQMFRIVGDHLIYVVLTSTSETGIQNLLSYITFA